MIPFALTAIVGLLAVLLPGPDMDWTIPAVACGLTVVLTAVALAVARVSSGAAVIGVLAIA